MGNFLNLALAFIVVLFLSGLYCIIISTNFIRILIGVELLTKGATLLLALGGYLSGSTSLSEALIITLIVIEVVVIATGAGIVIGAFRHANSLNAGNFRDLKG